MQFKNPIISKTNNRTAKRKKFWASRVAAFIVVTSIAISQELSYFDILMLWALFTVIFSSFVPLGICRRLPTVVHTVHVHGVHDVFSSNRSSEHTSNFCGKVSVRHLQFFT